MGTRSHREGVKQEITRGLERMHREHGPGAPVPSRNDIVNSSPGVPFSKGDKSLKAFSISEAL